MTSIKIDVQKFMAELDRVKFNQFLTYSQTMVKCGLCKITYINIKKTGKISLLTIKKMKKVMDIEKCLLPPYVQAKEKN